MYKSMYKVGLTHGVFIIEVQGVTFGFLLISSYDLGSMILLYLKLNTLNRS